MLLECWMVVAVLALRTVADAVGENRLEPIEVRAHDVDVLISHDSRKILPGILTHDAGLAMIRLKAFLKQDDGDVDRKSLYASVEGLVA
jgi:hypothetical protein